MQNPKYKYQKVTINNQQIGLSQSDQIIMQQINKLSIYVQELTNMLVKKKILSEMDLQQIEIKTQSRIKNGK